MWWESNTHIWRNFEGFKFTWCKVASDRFGLMHSPGKQAPGLGKDMLHAGGSSAYMAVNLAYLMGAARICLLGFDMQYTDGKSHWHGDHKKTGNPPKHELAKWAERFTPLYKDLESVGVPMINCTRQTALTTPWRDLDEELQ